MEIHAIRTVLLTIDLGKQDLLRKMFEEEIQRQGQDIVSNAEKALNEGKIRRDTFDHLKAMRAN